MAADDILASDLEIAFTEAAIEAHRKSPKQLPFTGQCHNCQACVESPKRFCNSECSEEYMWYQKRKNGAELFRGMA